MTKKNILSRICLLIILFFPAAGIAQEKPVQKDTLDTEYMIIEGDTVPREFIDLEEVVILEQIKFTSDLERRKYLILKRKTEKVFPYAKLASERLVELNRRLERIENRGERKRYTRIVQKYIEEQFAAELKKLTRTEGQILVKLIHRQTGITAFDLIKDLKSGWRAFWYNTTASLFDISLKEEFQPQTVQEDYLIEDILQRAFRSQVLEEQPTALDFNFLELTNKWSSSKRKQVKSQT